MALAAAHDTFLIEKSFARPPTRVFGAFADPERKLRWYAGSGAHDVVSYDLDFRVGGAETLIGVMRAGTPVAGARLKWSQAFCAIIVDRLIVFTQTVDFNAARISCALVTVELEDAGGGCLLRLTHQGVWFEGADGPQLRRLGWQALLESLAASLD